MKASFRRPRLPLRSAFVLLGTSLLLVGLSGCGGRSRRAEPEAPRMTTRAIEASQPRTIATSPVVAAPTAPVIGSEPERATPRRPETIGAVTTPAPVAEVERAGPPAAVPPPAREPVEATPRPGFPAGPADRHGLTEADYAGLLTPDETEVLRLRARGEIDEPLTRHLTERERENLRRRALESREIGAEPLRVGE